MRQSFIICMVILGVAIQMIGATLEQQPLLAQVDSKVTDTENPDGMTQQEVLDSLAEPSISDGFWESIVGGVTKIGTVMFMLGKIVFFYHASVWQGFGTYLYYLFILPLTVSFWVTVVVMLRGGSSS